MPYLPASSQRCLLALRRSHSMTGIIFLAGIIFPAGIILLTGIIFLANMKSPLKPLPFASS